MTAKLLRPHRSEVQDWEHSAERNPQSRGQRRALERQAEIRAGDGSAKDAAAEMPLAYPPREIPRVA
jgi:hypothetical protein